MTALIGWTGFVGLELLVSLDSCDTYNSSNIDSLRNKTYKRVYFAGLPAEKWRINQEPAKDRATLERILEILNTVTIEQFILISTVDVMDCTIAQDETGTHYASHPYGAHRRQMEEWVQRSIPDHYILRLPGLFGTGLKKNILYDLLHTNQLQAISLPSKFQWYNTANLITDMERCVREGNRLVHLVSEPVETRQIVQRFFPQYLDVCKGTATTTYQLLHRTGYWNDASTVLDQMGAWIQRVQAPRPSLAVSNIAWTSEQTDDILKLLKRYNLTQLEIAPTKLADWPLIDEQVLAAALTKPCKYVSCQSILFNTTIELFEHVDAFLAHYKRVAGICQTLGIRTIVFGSPKQRHLRGDPEPLFRQIAEISRAHQVLFCLEPNAKAYGCTWLTNLAETVAFVKDLNEDTIRVNVDTGNYCMEGDTFVFDATTLPFVGSIQVSNRFLGPLCTMTKEDIETTKALLHQLREVPCPRSLEMRPLNLSLLAKSVDLFVDLSTHAI